MGRWVGGCDLHNGREISKSGKSANNDDAVSVKLKLGNGACLSTVVGGGRGKGGGSMNWLVDLLSTSTCSVACRSKRTGRDGDGCDLAFAVAGP